MLRDARQQAGLSQRVLARRAGTARSTIAAYEAGAQSPTVRQLNRLLAGCNVVARVELEPRHAAHEAVLTTARAAGRPAALEDLPAVAATLRCRHGTHPITRAPTGRVWPPVTWAVDGATACCLQGVPLPVEHLEIVLQDDAGGRGWLKRVAARGFDATGHSLAPHWEEPAELARST